MYICPTCHQEFNTEEKITKHFLSCWKDKNPNHRSKPASRSADINTKQMSNEIMDFFNSFK